MEYDMIIVGAGPAGLTSAIYALRANQKILILEKEAVGGKIASAPLVENYPAIKEMTGFELASKLEEQVKALGGVINLEEVLQIQEVDEKKQVITNQATYLCQTVILATGSKYRTLQIEKEEKFLGRGISFCASCDGFFYKNKTVAVIGGGSSAVINALELSNVCQKVYIIQNLDHLTAEIILIDRLLKKENIEIRYNSTVTKLEGEELITGIQIREEKEQKKIEVDGIFLSIGQIPETTVAKDIVTLSDQQYIVTNEELMTSQKGIFAAGDCINKKIRQLTTAVNDGTIAALSAMEYIDQRKRK